MSEFKAGDQVRLDGAAVTSDNGDRVPVVGFLHRKLAGDWWDLLVHVNDYQNLVMPVHRTLLEPAPDEDPILAESPLRLEGGQWEEDRLTPVEVPDWRDARLLTAAEMLDDMKARQRKLILRAGYSLPKPRIVGTENVNRQPISMTLPGEKKPKPSVATVMEGIARWLIANPHADLRIDVAESSEVFVFFVWAKKSVYFVEPVSADEVFAQIEAAANPKDTP